MSPSSRVHRFGALVLALMLFPIGTGDPAAAKARPSGAGVSSDAGRLAPLECAPAASGSVNWAECYAASPRQSPARQIAAMNLGTQAVRTGAFSEAVRWYDEAQFVGQTLWADLSYHAYRTYALEQVGRGTDAALEAVRAWRLLAKDASLPPGVVELAWSQPFEEDDVLTAILPSLKRADEAAFRAGLTRLRALPMSDWISMANRAAVLGELGDWDGALAVGTQAYQLNPDHPAVLNQQCWSLANLRRAAEALAFCESALERAPNIGAIRHSHAFALAQLGRCKESAAELVKARQIDPALRSARSNIVCQPTS